MEGNLLTFFVTYQDKTAEIIISEYDTVEQLKIEIDLKLNVAVSSQYIDGWREPPQSDDTILLCCSMQDDVNCLIVRQIDPNKNTFKENNSYDDQMDITDNTSGTNYLEREIEAIIRLKEKLPEDVPLRIMQMSFQDAISHVCKQKKVLLLYLHNSQDEFSQNFLVYIHDDAVKTHLEEKCFVIGWDIEDPYHHNALVRALEPYSNLSLISHLITDKTAAAVCLLPGGDNEQLSLFFCLRGSVSFGNVAQSLRNVPSASEYGAGEETMEHTASIEIEAIKSLKQKLPVDISVTFRHFSLDDAINFICTSPFNERKTLLLYLHNSELPFSQMFCQNLKNSELARILNRNFLVLGWDVGNPQYHDALVSALSKHINLAVVADLVTNKVSVGLCILPVSGTISVYLCLRGKITLKDTIKSLKEAEKAFEKEIEREKEVEKIELEKSNKQQDLGSEKLHGIWAEMLGDRDYDSFEYDQHNFLKEKIGFGLKGPPEKETGYDAKTLKQVDELFEVISNESNRIAEFKDHIEMAFIYNCLEPLAEEKIKRAKKYPDYNPQTDVNPVPVFILRKCRGSEHPCRVFIDDTGRVYQNWTEYLTRNKFPEYEMVVPLDGRYQVVDNQVLLERHLSPACHLDTKLLQVGDIVSTAAGLASGAVFMTAAVGIASIPVAAPVLLTAGVVGAGAGVWAIGRSAYSLYDRMRHNESMSFANSEARGAYLNIVAGSLGFAGAGANMALTQLVARGANIGQGATYLVTTIGVLNISAGGASLVNSGYEVFDQWYNENQTPSALTILQLSSSVLFFGHAVYNFKGAQTIIDETQARVLKDYQDSLRSNRHRKAFNKLMKETIRTRGDTARGNADVISAIRNIPNKDEVFAALTRNNKRMNEAGVRFSAEGGKITVSLSGMPVDMNEFIGLNHKQTEVFLGNLAQQQRTGSTTATANTTTAGSSGPSSSSSGPSSTSSTSSTLKDAVKRILCDLKVDVTSVNLGMLMTLTSELLIFCSGDVKTKVVNAVHQAIRYILKQVSASVAQEIDKVVPKNTQFHEFLRLGISFFSQNVDKWEQRYQMYQQTGNERYFHPIFEQLNPVYLKRTVTFFEFVVRNSFSGDTLTRAVLTEMSGFVTAWVTRVIFDDQEREESERRRARHSANSNFRPRTKHCDVCGGYYYCHGS